MKTETFRTLKTDRYDIATEVMSSAVRVLQAAGFFEEEIPKLFEQVANRRARGPLWIEPWENRVGSRKTRRSSPKASVKRPSRAARRRG
jgi:hypothetical protein